LDTVGIYGAGLWPTVSGGCPKCVRLAINYWGGSAWLMSGLMSGCLSGDTWSYDGLRGAKMRLIGKYGIRAQKHGIWDDPGCKKSGGVMQWYG